MRYAFKDQDGNVKILVETSIPGFVLVPEDSHPSEVVEMDQKEFDKSITKLRSDAIMKKSPKA